jgi:hypothetical protein
LAPTVGIAATGFCYLGGILQLFHRRHQQIFSTSSRSTNFAAADSSIQIASTKFVINKQRHVNFVIAVSYGRLVHRHGIIEQQGSNYEKGHQLIVLVITYPRRC